MNISIGTNGKGKERVEVVHGEIGICLESRFEVPSTPLPPSSHKQQEPATRIFINICHSPKIEGEVDKELRGCSGVWRVPYCLGPARLELYDEDSYDKQGFYSFVFDILFNSLSFHLAFGSVISSPSPSPSPSPTPLPSEEKGNQDLRDILIRTALETVQSAVGWKLQPEYKIVDDCAFKDRTHYSISGFNFTKGVSTSSSIFTQTTDLNSEKPTPTESHLYNHDHKHSTGCGHSHQEYQPTTRKLDALHTLPSLEPILSSSSSTSINQAFDPLAFGEVSVSFPTTSPSEEGIAFEKLQIGRSQAKTLLPFRYTQTLFFLSIVLPVPLDSFTTSTSSSIPLETTLETLDLSDSSDIDPDSVRTEFSEDKVKTEAPSTQFGSTPSSFLSPSSQIPLPRQVLVSFHSKTKKEHERSYTTRYIFQIHSLLHPVVASQCSIDLGNPEDDLEGVKQRNIVVVLRKEKAMLWRTMTTQKPK